MPPAQRSRRPFIAWSAALLLGATSCTLAYAEDVVRIGVTAGPHAQIAEVARQVAARDGLKLQIVEFQDYVAPNAALDAGDLQANSYQHLPFLQGQIEARGYKLSAVGETVTYPMGVYARKYKSPADLPDRARVGIPNDPSNSGRALALLQKAGLIKLKPDAGVTATPLDVIENPKRLQILQIDAAQLPRALDDLAAAAINTNYAVQAQLVPTRDALAIESARGPYANLLVVRTQDKDRPWVPKLVKAYHSAEVRAYIEQNFAGSVVPAF